MCMYALCSFLSTARAYNSILLSSFSAVDGYHFRLLMEQIKPKAKARNSLVYIPTAAYAPSKSSMKSAGEQRRRARYDARQKKDLLKEAFEIETAVILELDDPKLQADQISIQLQNAAVIYIDGGIFHFRLLVFTYTLLPHFSFLLVQFHSSIKGTLFIYKSIC